MSQKQVGTATHPTFRGRISSNMDRFFCNTCPDCYGQYLRDGSHGEVRETVGIYDGGNTMVLTNMSGSQIAILGKSTLYLNHLMLINSGFFKEAAVTAVLNRYKGDESKGTAGDENFYKALAKSGFLPEKYTEEDVATFYAQNRYIKEIVIPEDLGLAPTQILFVEQIAYHIDLYLAPAPNGGVIVMDLAKSADLLQKLREANNPTQALTAALAKAYEHTKKEADVQAHSIETIVAQLKMAGFSVVRAPSAFLADEQPSSFISFLNPLYGRNEKIAEPAGESKISEDQLPSNSYFWYSLDPFTEPSSVDR